MQVLDPTIKGEPRRAPPPPPADSSSPVPAPTLTSPPHPLPWVLRLPLTCFGCICKLRSTNGAMNRYIPVGKAQLKFFHRPLSSLVQRGRAERKPKEQEQERGEKRGRKKQRQRERERQGKRDRVCVEREAHENKGGGKKNLAEGSSSLTGHYRPQLLSSPLHHPRSGRKPACSVSCTYASSFLPSQDH